MGQSKLVQVDAFFDGIAAHQAKNWLDHEGIPAFVEGTNANSAFYVGNALTGVKLLVASEDEEKAANVLRQYRSTNPETKGWYCGACQEHNEPSFDLCWSCGQNREDVEATAPSKSVRQSSGGAALEDAENEFTEAKTQTNFETGNPYQPPLASLSADTNKTMRPDSEPTEESDRTEEVIQRAWRASIFGLGLVFPIPFLQLYSVILLLGVDRSVPIESRFQRQFKMAWIVNSVVLLGAAVAVALILIR